MMFKIICLFIFGCAGPWLPPGLPLVAESRGFPLVVVRASHCCGFPCGGAGALGTWASVTAALGSLVIVLGP